jgi:hypothetical protein
MNPTSPKATNQNVERLLSLLNVHATPVQVSVSVDPTGKIENCYNNVLNKISKIGGSISYGWVIWEFDYWYEAEHHAIWVDENGLPLDITPHPFTTDTIMFVEDNNRKYTGTTFLSQRLNTTGNEIVDDLIVVRDCVDHIWLTGRRIDESTISLPLKFVDAMNGLKQIEAGILQHVRNAGTFHSPCFCSSGRTYQTCHGEDLISNMKLLKARIDSLSQIAP